MKSEGAVKKKKQEEEDCPMARKKKKDLLAEGWEVWAARSRRVAQRLPVHVCSLGSALGPIIITGPLT